MSSCINSHCQASSKEAKEGVVCNSLQAYAEKCADMGQPVAYRTRDLCRKFYFFHPETYEPPRGKTNNVVSEQV